MSRLENNELWQKAKNIAEETYGQLDRLPEEEKWGMQSKLRGRALDLSTDVAEAIGSIDPRDKHYYFGHAKKSLFGIKNIYHIAIKTDLLAVEPEAMVRIDALSSELDTEISKAAKAIPKYMQLYTVEVKK